MQTAFTVSIEAKKGLQPEFQLKIELKQLKLQLIQKLKKVKSYLPDMFFLLVARNGGVLERAGHTEASVDISKLSN